MHGTPSPATAVVVARLASGTRPSTWRDLDTLARRAGGPVTWAADAETLAPLVSDEPHAPWALLLDAAAMASRRDLRTRLALATRLAPAIEAVVCAPGAILGQRDLLVDAGIRIAAVGRFDEAGRGSRRPPPDGWSCRSVVWGMWEAETTAPRGPGLVRWLPWGGRPMPGSLSVTAVDLDADSRIAGAVLAAAIGRFHDRRGVRMTRLADLPTLLGGEERGRSGSVLRAA